jgi:pimeloyl-ACP methyl ester carboxylesterase
MKKNGHSRDSTRTKARRWRLHTLVLTLAVLQRLSPRLSGHVAAWLWFMPGVHARRPRAHPIFADAQEIRFGLRGKQVVAYRWGSGPRVLLMHGWGGNSTHLAKFVRPLLTAGLGVLALDAPAHGSSSGRATTVFEIAEAIGWLAKRHGPLVAAITHSFGAMSVVVALGQGVSMERLVLISPPAHAEGLVAKFATRLSLRQASIDVLRSVIERRTGEDVWGRLALDRLSSPPSLPTLVIHDHDDADVPVTEGRNLADHWPKGRLLETQGLGHRRILRDQAVIRAAVLALGPISDRAKKRIAG